jgi:predicted lipid-binding transport protein (Tim44 family)
MRLFWQAPTLKTSVRRSSSKSLLKPTHAVLRSRSRPYVVSIRECCAYSHSKRLSDSPADVAAADEPGELQATVDVVFSADDGQLGEDEVLVDIGKAQEVLHEVLGHYAHVDLDTLEEFRETAHTVECVAQAVYHHVTDLLREAHGMATTTHVEVTIRESDDQTATYDDEEDGSDGFSNHTASKHNSASSLEVMALP